MTHQSVSAICPGGTVLCVASGPSLTQADVDLCRGQVDAAIAINTSYRMVPWATALYAADAHWWEDYPDARTFQGFKYTCESGKSRKWQQQFPDVQILQTTGHQGLELKPNGLRTGLNSGYQCIGLAVHFLGACPGRILLLGYDLQLGPNREWHWHGKHKRHSISPYDKWLPHFQTLVKPLQALRIEVINCTRRTALRAFPQMSIEQALMLAPIAVAS